LRAAITHPGPESALIVQGLALELAAWASRTRREPFDALPRWLVRLRDELHDAPGETPTLDDIGRRTGRHPVYVARAFRRHFGRSLGEYARDLRVAHAARLLTRTRDPLVEVAFECGFSDQAHFARWVKRRIGVTPGQIRALHDDSS
jgi:AraC family transcriptional regulator